jgi:hypothetical protein
MQEAGEAASLFEELGNIKRRRAMIASYIGEAPWHGGFSL